MQFARREVSKFDFTRIERLRATVYLKLVEIAEAENVFAERVFAGVCPSILRSKLNALERAFCNAYSGRNHQAAALLDHATVAVVAVRFFRIGARFSDDGNRRSNSGAGCE